MLCKKPFTGHKTGGYTFGCWRCGPCRRRRRRSRTDRLLLESTQHSKAAFITCTYADEFLPHLGSLVPSHLSDFMNRFHRSWPDEVRWFGCGEYGTLGQRPHYHLIVFGFQTCVNASWLWPRKDHGTCDCRQCSYVRDRWGMGKIHLGQVSPDSMQYVAGYMSKESVVKEKDLNGRHKEFCRSSQPGIGSTVVPKLVEILVDNPSFLKDGDVPQLLLVGNRKIFLDSYMRRKLRAEMGSKDVRAPEACVQESRQELRELYKDPANFETCEAAGVIYRRKKSLQEINKQALWNFDAKESIFNQMKGVL